MGFFKMLGRAVNVIDVNLATVENISMAGEVASRSTITMAENFNAKQTAKLEKQKAKITARIADAKANNADDIDFDDI